jgi:hypothetical protein
LGSHAYKIKNMGVNIGPDNDEVAIARLMTALPSAMAVPLPKEQPPPLVLYPKHAARPAPTRAAVAFELKNFAAISAALAGSSPPRTKALLKPRAAVEPQQGRQ